MSKHTKGPWRVVSTRRAIGADGRLMVRSEEWAIAIICSDPHEDELLCPETEQANADLIAAAPEMAELLLEIYEDVPRRNRKGFIGELLTKAGGFA